MAENNMEIAVPEQTAIQLTGSPEDRLKQGREAASALMSVATPINIGGKEYLQIQDWQTIGAFYGLFAGADEAEPVSVEGIPGFKAKAQVRTQDGVIISSAVGYCMDEGIWKGREKFAQASMAQTRASAKALRMVLSWVAQLGGYQGTPAEEMDFQDKPLSNNNSLPDNYFCPACGGGVWDNRVDGPDGKELQPGKSGNNRPAFTCKGKECKFFSYELDPETAGVVKIENEEAPHKKEKKPIPPFERVIEYACRPAIWGDAKNQHIDRLKEIANNVLKKPLDEITEEEGKAICEGIRDGDFLPF